MQPDFRTPAVAFLLGVVLAMPARAQDTGPAGLDYGSSGGSRTISQQSTVVSSDVAPAPKPQAQRARQEPAAPPATPPKSAKPAGIPGADDEDFESAYRQIEPLSPNQIRELGRRRVELERARTDRKDPDVSTKSINATLRPGNNPPLIHLSDGYATALSVLDRTGESWAINSATVGSSEDFKVDLPSQPGNVLIVSPKHPFARSNLILLLQGATVPLTLSLASGRDVTYYNANIVLDSLGPNARPPVAGPPLEQADTQLMRAILDGAGPVTNGVKLVEVRGGGESTTAFLADGRFFLRTPYTVLSPAWQAIVHSADMAVYEMPTVVPFISMTDDAGRPFTLTVPESALLSGALATRTPTTTSNP